MVEVTEALFDDWPERYEDWFRTPIGRLVRELEGEVVLDLLQPRRGQHVLDAGCGTGVFTTDFIAAGAEVIGLDLSLPMLKAAVRKTFGTAFFPVQSDMRWLPFQDERFDKAVSITAIEFVEDAESVVKELFRVTRPGGYVLVATLSSLSSWAERRKAKTLRGERHILENAHYRSPDDVLALCPFPGVFRTAIHFERNDDVNRAVEVEERGRRQRLNTGAFVAVRWQKPVSS